MTSSLGGPKKPYTVGMNKTTAAAATTANRPLIPCLINEQNRHELQKPLKVEAVKIILSAMWFTDTAGVDKIFVEYKPHAKELETMAYKPYKHVYRLCFSFHSSFEEIVDFVNTLRPGRIFSIALPPSTTDQMVNDYFYSKGQFVKFHSVSTAGDSEHSPVKKCSTGESLKSKHLVFRKRKSNLSETGMDSSNDDLSNSEHESGNGSFNFGSEDEDDSCCCRSKKLKV
jgi:hypothetical protein